MANYAIITGIDIKSQDQGRLAGCAYKNTVAIHKFLRSIGYNTVRILGPLVTARRVADELSWIRNKLKRGDTFLFYYYGRAVYTDDAQYISLDWRSKFAADLSDYTNVELIEKETRIHGVKRIIILDTYCLAEEKDRAAGITDGINKILVKKAIGKTNSNARKDTTPHFPIGCYFSSHGFLPLDGDSVFSTAVLQSFTSQARLGLGISFPSICESISENFKERAATILPDNCGEPPYFEGDKVVLLSEENADLHNSNNLSDEQKKVKRDADQLLEQAFKEHEEWFKNPGRSDFDNGRLSWEKLEPIFEMYESKELEPPALTYRVINEADFDNSRFPNGVNFSGSFFIKCSFKRANLDSVNFSRCYISECNFLGLCAVQCDFSGSILHKPEFKFSNLIGCYFQDSRIEEGCFEGAILDVASFSNTNADLCIFLGCFARRTDFTNANLACSVLTSSDFSDALLTGVRLYGTARTDWCIENVKCDYVYWDRVGKERFPLNNDFADGEFSMKYGSHAVKEDGIFALENKLQKTEISLKQQEEDAAQAKKKLSKLNTFIKQTSLQMDNLLRDDSTTEKAPDQFSLLPLPPAAQSLQFANGPFISLKLKEKIIILSKRNSIKCPDTGVILSCDRSTINKARKSDLVQQATLKYLSCLLDVTERELTFTRIVPHKSNVYIARKMLAREAKKNIRDWFGSQSDVFFEQIEVADDISAECMKVIYHHYKKLLEDKHKNKVGLSPKTIEPKALIDEDKTLSLHTQLLLDESTRTD